MHHKVETGEDTWILKVLIYESMTLMREIDIHRYEGENNMMYIKDIILSK